MKDMLSNLTRAPFLIGLVLLLTTIAYWPGLNGNFILDDFPNIVSNQDLHIDKLRSSTLAAAALSADSGLLKRPVAMLSFSLNHYASGLDPFYFKLTNLFIHLLNGLAVLLLTHLILTALCTRTADKYLAQRIMPMSLATMAIWLLHPLNLSTVLYVVQRMTSLSALFVFFGLIFYVQGRSLQLGGKRGIPWILVGLLFFGPLSLLSKENGALLPLYMLIIEVSLFRFQSKNASQRAILISIFSVTLLIPAIAVAIYTLVRPEWITSGYILRDFSLTERILTESRIIIRYLVLILLPTNSAMGLYHDDIEISRGFLDPTSTLASTAVIGAMILMALFSVRRSPVLSMGILLFLAGHLLESTVFPLELMYEHRNYFPSYGIIFAIVFYALHPRTVARYGKAGVAGATLFTLMLAFITANRSAVWGNPMEHAVYEAYTHPNSPRANMDLATKYAVLSATISEKSDYYYDKATEYFLRSASLRGSYTSGLFGLIKTACVLNRPIKPEWTADLSDRLANKPFWVNSINWLEILGDYKGKLGCTVPPDIMLSFIRASLSNPRITTDVRVLLLTTSSKYFAWRLRDHETALYLLAQAASLEPRNPAPHVHLAILLNTMERKDDALKELETARQLDRLGRFARQIREQGRIAIGNEP